MKIDVYATTIHELGHATHWELRGRSDLYFANHTHCELRESWATAVEWAITSHKYRFFLGGNQPFSYNNHIHQLLNNSSNDMRNGYTPFMIDLIDEENQSLRFNPPINILPDDEVIGFTIKDCENAIRGNIRNFGDFYGRIISLPTSQSQLPQLATLFEFYNSIQYNCGGGNHQPNTRQEGGVR
jgi:hypothetical protein